jgi:hypothetical protein
MDEQIYHVAISARLKAVAAVLFPIVICAIASIPIILSEQTYADYLERVTGNTGLLVKYVIFGILGAIGIIIWFIKIFPKAILAILDKNHIYINKSRDFFYGKNHIVRMNSGSFAFDKTSFMEHSLVVSVDGQSFVCGELTYLFPKPEAILLDINNIIQSWEAE